MGTGSRRWLVLALLVAVAACRRSSSSGGGGGAPPPPPQTPDPVVVVSMVECDAGLARCGTSCVELTTDRAHCGGCGLSCVAAEACAGSACRPCPDALCGGACVRLAADEANCGACGNACAAGQACVGGACRAPVTVTILDPADGGYVPTTAFSQRIRVESALDVRTVTLEVISGGSSSRVAAALTAAPMPGDPVTTWAATVSVPDGAMLLAKAFDAAYVPSAAGSALHSASAQVGPVTRLAEPATTPAVSATGPGGAAIAQGSWIGLNAGPVTLRATGVGGAAKVQFINRGIGDAFVLGTAPVAGGEASLTLAPGELTAAAGRTRIVACPVDAAGQVTAMARCADGSPASTLTLDVGWIQASVGGHVMTAQADGSAPTLFWVDPSASSTLTAVRTDLVVAGPPGVEKGGARYRGGASGLRASWDGAAGVIAVRADGSQVDRFDCATGIGCDRVPYAARGAHPSAIATVVAETTRALLVVDAAGAYASALEPAAAGSVTAPAVSAFSPAAYPVSGGSLFGDPGRTLASGAVVVWTQASAGAGPYRLWLVHPALPGGRAQLGPTHDGPPIALYAAPSGEILWVYDNGGQAVVQAASYDGASAAPVVSAPSEQVSWAGFTAPPVLVRPKVLLFGAAQVGTELRMAGLVDLRPASPAVLFPTPPVGATGPLAMGVRNRQGASDWFAVSEDQLKAIYLTADVTGDAQVPTFPTSYTLWLLDVGTGTATPLHSSPRLMGPAVGSEFGPHFVQSPAAWTRAVPGAAPSGALAPVPAVVFADGADVGGPTYLREATLHFAVYGAGAQAPTPTMVDRTALFPAIRGTWPTVTESATGASLVFLSGAEGALDLRTVSIAPGASVATSSVLLDEGITFHLRDDTGWLVALRSDGSLWGGALAPGATPALRWLGDGGIGADPSLNPVVDPARTFGLTADGQHAWIVVGDSAGWILGISPDSTLRLVHLPTAARTNVGQAVSPVYADDPSPPCFLGDAAAAIAISQPPGWRGTGELFAEDVASGARTRLLSTPVTFYGSTTPNCLVAVDRSEALVTDPGTYQSAHVVRSPQGGLAVASFTGTNLWPLRTSTYAPHGGPYLPDAALHQVTVSGAVRFLFKSWGNQALTGAAAPFRVVSTGAFGTYWPRVTATNQALLLSFSGNGTAGVAFPISGLPAPAPPLP